MEVCFILCAGTEVGAYNRALSADLRRPTIATVAYGMTSSCCGCSLWWCLRRALSAGSLNGRAAVVTTPLNRPVIAVLTRSRLGQPSRWLWNMASVSRRLRSALLRPLRQGRQKKRCTLTSKHGPKSHSGARSGPTVSLTLIRPRWS